MSDFPNPLYKMSMMHVLMWEACQNLEMGKFGLGILMLKEAALLVHGWLAACLSSVAATNSCVTASNQSLRNGQRGLFSLHWQRRPVCYQLTKRPIFHPLTKRPVFHQLTKRPIFNSLTKRPVFCQLTERPIFHQLTKRPIFPQCMKARGAGAAYDVTNYSRDGVGDWGWGISWWPMPDAWNVEKSHTPPPPPKKKKERKKGWVQGRATKMETVEAV